MAKTFFEIPLTPNAQTFLITLAGKQYRMTLIYRDTTEGGWFLDIATSGGVSLLRGLPLVTGVDLLAPYPDLNFGGSLYATTDGNPDAVPTFSNLGVAGRVFFAVPA